jgi:predicted ATPase
LQDMLAVWINTQAGGNPLYALELAQALQQAEAVFLDRSTGEIRWTGLIPALPLSLRELLLARFDELTLAEQTVLKWGAVIGSSFDLAALLALSGKRLELSEIRLALAGAGQASFISFSGDESYRFTHPLMHETIYETLAFAQRQSWHTQLGDWLVAARPTSPLELKAHHYLRGGDVAKAVEFGLAVGDRARQLGVYVGAVDYYEQVLALTGLSPETERQVSERLADVLALQADYTAAKTLYLQAGELGSATAREKFALLTADLSTLRQTPFSPAQSLWAAGAKAWLLAQAGQIELALAELQQSLTEAAVPPPLALKQLGQQLQSGQPVADYEVWLGAFVDQVLAGPPA